MIQRRFEKLEAVLKSLGLVALLFISACASQQTKDSTIDEQIETMKMIEETEQNSASTFVQQDMGLLSLHERNEKEALRNLQIELKEEQLRVPAQEEETKVEEKVEAETKPTEEAGVTTEAASSWSTAKIQTLSKEEMSQELFEADSIVVQKGDSLSGLAEKHLGNKKAWARIWSINPNIQNPNVIEVGSKLYMPKVEEAGRGIASVDEKPAAPAPLAVKEEETAAAPLAEEAPLTVQEVTPVTPVQAPAVPTAAKKAKAVTAEPTKVEPVKTEITKTEAIKVEEAAPLATSPVKIPDLAPTVEAKVAAPAAAAPVKAEVAATAAVQKGGSSHTTDELLMEHLDSKRAIKFKGKTAPASPFPARKISSVNDNGPDEPVKMSMSSAPKGLAKVISFAGLLIMVAVLAGFFYNQKPKNQ